MQSDKDFLKEVGKSRQQNKHKRKRFRFPNVLNGNVGALLDYFKGD